MTKSHLSLQFILRRETNSNISIETKSFSFAFRKKLVSHFNENIFKNYVKLYWQFCDSVATICSKGFAIKFAGIRKYCLLFFFIWDINKKPKIVSISHTFLQSCVKDPCKIASQTEMLRDDIHEMRLCEHLSILTNFANFRFLRKWVKHFPSHN